MLTDFLAGFLGKSHAGDSVCSSIIGDIPIGDTAFFKRDVLSVEETRVEEEERLFGCCSDDVEGGSFSFRCSSWALV